MKLKILFIMMIIPSMFLSSISLQSINYYTSITYDNDKGVELFQAIKVANQNYIGEFFIAIDGGQYGTVNNRRVEDWQGTGTGYTIYDSKKVIVKDISTASDDSEVLKRKFNAQNQTKRVTYYIAMEKDKFPPAGYFSDTIKVSLYKGNLSNYTFVQSINIQIAVQVQNDIALSIVPKNSAFDASKTDMIIDFGELTPGLQREVDIVVKSNLNFKIDLASNNGGTLNLKNVWGAKEVNYSLTVNNSVIDLIPWQSVTVLQGSATGASGSRASLIFTIDDFWDVQDGEYEDTIRVTISSN